MNDFAPIPTGEHVTDPYDAIPPGEHVPRVRTPLDADQLREALRVGHLEATGSEPSYDRLSSAWSMCCVEHAVANGGPVIHGYAIWCNNLGNINARGWAGDHFSLTADEILQGKRVPITQQLRAHSGPEAGASDYWTVLLARWPEAVAAFDEGDLLAAALRLKEKFYYTAAAADYARGLQSWAKDYARRWPRP